MKTKVNDDRDPMKEALGERIRWLQENDPPTLSKMLSALSDEEAFEIMHDDEIMLRKKQWLNLGWDEDLILVCSGRGLVFS